MYYSLPILRARENEEGATGVTVGSEMDERDLKQAGRTVCASLCIRYLPIFFLVGQSSSAKKFPCGLFLRFLSLKKTVYYHLICSSTRLSSSLPFHVTSLSISFRSSRRLASRGLRLCTTFRPVDFPPTTTTLALKWKTHLPASFVISNLFPTTL